MVSEGNSGVQNALVLERDRFSEHNLHIVNISWNFMADKKRIAKVKVSEISKGRAKG